MDKIKKTIADTASNEIPNPSLTSQPFKGVHNSIEVDDDFLSLSEMIPWITKELDHPSESQPPQSHKPIQVTIQEIHDFLWPDDPKQPVTSQPFKGVHNSIEVDDDFLSLSEMIPWITKELDHPREPQPPQPSKPIKITIQEIHDFLWPDDPKDAPE